jgi:RNA polymerase sigma factor (sigma-70 family)
MSKEVKELVDHLFRFKAGQMTATLTRIFGFENSDLVENVVNEAMAKALKVWRFDELPDNPEGWLYVTAKNLALDHLRRESKWNQKREILEQELQVFKEKPEEVELQIFEDDQLKMIFMCCHPELAPEVRVALTLKSLCGFHASEIANAFLDKTTTIEQRLVRAKKKILEQKLEMDLPHNELDQRVDSVLDTLYLFFNEGYSASRGDSLLRRELCLEAIR